MAFLYWLIADKIIIAPNKVARKYIYAPFCVPDKCHEKRVSAPNVPSLNNPEEAGAPVVLNPQRDARQAQMAA